ncbi:MAG: hypothetical protein GY870_08755, partial [archaeon]|nr:hypothetical protein [archaeon]
SLEIYKEIDSEESQYGVDRLNTLIENLDEIEKELDEEEFYLHKFGLTYDNEDFF